jgi:hypothetical protein
MKNEDQYNQIMKAVKTFNYMFPVGVPIKVQLESGNLLQSKIIEPAKFVKGLPHVKAENYGWVLLSQIKVEFRIHELDTLDIDYSIEPKANPKPGLKFKSYKKNQNVVP